MPVGEHETLRRKVLKAKAARPPIGDPVYVGEMFARLLEERLRSTLSMPTEVVFEDSGVRRYGEVAADFPDGALLGIARLRGGGFGGLLPLSRPFVVHLIEALSGATESAAASPETSSAANPAANAAEGEAESAQESAAAHGDAAGARALTLIDEALSEDFATHAINCFERAVAPSGRAESRGALRFERFVRLPVEIMEASDGMEVLEIRLKVALGAGAEPQMMTLILTLAVLDFYKAEATARAIAAPPATDGGRTSPDTVWAATMTKAANLAEFPLVAILTQLKLSLAEIGEMKPGSILPLPDAIGMDVDLRVDRIGGVARSPDLCGGALGAAGGRRAIKITDPPPESFIERLAPYLVDGQ